MYQRWTFAAESFLAEGPVLEVGCGAGHLLARLAANGIEVTGVDISPNMVTLAERRLRRAGLTGRVICADARRLPLPDASIGTIINAFPMPYVKEQATWAEYTRVLRPGGRWVVVEGPHLQKLNVRLVGWYLLLLAEFGLRLGRNRRDATVPLRLFPDQRREFVKVGPAPVAVVILQKGRPGSAKSDSG
jgi:ubiquinone/menaquinone biosynthesis C-methylase UbiE